MNIFLEDNGGKLIPSDIVISWINRSDLVPVPRTIEFAVQIKSGLEKDLVEGAYVWTGAENLKYQIIKTKKINSLGAIQNDSPLQALQVYAVLAATAPICFRAEKPVIKRSTTIGEMFRACGANLGVDSDISIDSFACLKGFVPSLSIAKVLQEQSAAVVLKNKKLTVARIADLLKQDPVDAIGQFDSTDTIESEFDERHQIPSFYSVKPDGTIVQGNFDQARQTGYVPQKDTNTLHNMSKVLVTRKIVDSDMVQTINAGMTLQILDKKYLIITAAHFAFAVDGIKQTGSRFWVGDLS